MRISLVFPTFLAEKRVATHLDNTPRLDNPGTHDELLRAAGVSETRRRGLVLCRIYCRLYGHPDEHRSARKRSELESDDEL